MNDYAVVLQKDNMVVKASNFTFNSLDDIKFSHNGKVNQFIYSGTTYYAIYDFNSGAFIDYADENKFNDLITTLRKAEGDKYTGVGTAYWKNTQDPSKDITFKNYSSLVSASVGDDIYGALRDETGLCYNYYTWEYISPYTGPLNQTKADGAPVMGFNCIVLTDGIQKTFYDQFNGKSFYDLDSDTAVEDQQLVGDVASLMQTVNQQALQAFSNFVISGLTDGPNIGVFTFTENADGNYSRQDLIDYANGLRQWLIIFKNYQNQLKTLTDPAGDPDQQDAAKTYILCDLLYRYNMLTLISVDLKIQIIMTLCRDSLLDWYFASFKQGFQHRESLVVKIIQAVTNSQASEFLDKLISNNLITQVSIGGVLTDITTTLYQTLFAKVDDFFGRANFTAMINRLANLTLIKNGVTIDPSKKYSITELQQMTTAQFFWGDINNKNEANYTLDNSTQATITYQETMCVATKIRAVYTGGHPPELKGYENDCMQYQKRNITVNHFDVVSIHFYSYPSFVDTSSMTKYAENSYLTFGGFINYLLEKEDTQTIVDIMQAGLLIIGLIAGFGEIAAAVRTADLARFLAGSMIISGDVSIFLSSNPAFRNYIAVNYPNDSEAILDTLLIVGTLTSLGGSAGNGLIGAYSGGRAGQFIGTAQQVLADPVASANLVANDIAILQEGLLRFRSASFLIQNDADFIDALNEGVGEIKFFNSNDLRTQILALSEDDQNEFYSKFNNIADNLTNLLKENPNALFVWSNINATGRTIIEQDLITYLNSFQVRPLILNNSYTEIAQVYGKIISSSYQVPSLPGINWVIDGVADDQALIAANNIANDSSDISVIANNYNVPLNIMQRVKSHFWNDEQMILVDDGTFQIGRFEKNSSDITEWENAISNSLSSDEELIFRRTIAHEYIEAKLIDQGMNFRANGVPFALTPSDYGAHDLAPIINDGTYADLGRLTNPDPADFNAFSNLDTIVEFYVNFYKL